MSSSAPDENLNSLVTMRVYPSGVGLAGGELCQLCQVKENRKFIGKFTRAFALLDVRWVTFDAIPPTADDPSGTPEQETTLCVDCLIDGQQQGVNVLSGENGLEWTPEGFSLRHRKEAN